MSSVNEQAMEKRQKIIIATALSLMVAAALAVSFFAEGETSRVALHISPVPAFFLLMIPVITGRQNRKDN